MPKMVDTVPTPTLEADEIQGNVLAGFNKDHQTFLFVRLPEDQVAAKAWLRDVTSEVATQTEVLAFNSLYKQLRGRRHSRIDGMLSVVWMNLAFTASGLARLGHTEDLTDQPQAFREGLAARAASLGHSGTSGPDHWQPCFRNAEGIDAVMIIAGDSPDELCEAVLDDIDRLGEHGGTVVNRLEGNARVDEPGHEHFGFKDGVSQPGVRGITPSLGDVNQGDPGQDLLWPGEFVLGYPRQKRPSTPASSQYPPQPEPEIDIHEPGDTITPTPDWTKNGSFLVFQRLAQDVVRFRDLVSRLAVSSGLSEELLAAKLVGRHKSGCPLELIKGLDDVGQLTGDVGLTDPTVVDAGHINNFEYQDNDADGHNVPRGAHIRKAYPRDEEPPGELDTQTHRIMRRGIAFGPSFRSGAPFGSAAHSDTPRGLLFACYQSSIEDQFEFVQSRWVNNADFPQSGDGVDAILNEADNLRTTVPGVSPPELALEPFITMTGGAYFFSPSLSALQLLASD